MKLKNHLIAIAVITFVVLIAWKLLQAQAPAPAPGNSAAPSPYNIIIVRASWGLNCLERFASADQISENNIQQPIINLCNGKAECIISISEANKVFNFLPECTDKVMEVDYRCFSFDRLRSVKASNGQLELKCSNLVVNSSK